jgi:hypothetical protein
MNAPFAPCGIDCGICQVYIATQNNDSEARKRLADEFYNKHGNAIDPETLLCDGCASDGRHIGFCAMCQIRACAMEHGFATCAECPEFPCSKGQFIWTSNSQSLANLMSTQG